jgi:hypothetical protein
MSPRAIRTVRSALLKKGFVEKNSHHVIFRLYVGGGKTDVCTYFSHGAKECNDFLLGRMAEQLMLSRARLTDLIDCALSGDAYVEMLRERGIIKT